MTSSRIFFIITACLAAIFPVSAFLSLPSNRIASPLLFSKAKAAVPLTKLNASPLKIFTENKKDVLKKYEKRAKAITAMEDEIEKLSAKEIRQRTKELKEMISAKAAISTEEGEKAMDSVLEECFALCREAAWRVLGLRHYDVQLMGGMALHDGRLAEMATGEGKTLVATCPAYLNALSGKGVTVITANDYLARRDEEVMGQVYRYLGLSVGLVQGSMTSAEKFDAYHEDITYVTNKELGFDYLRDNLALNRQDCVLGLPEMRLGFCIIDEADSILIDEARTPLIISEQVPAPGEKFLVASKVARGLEKGKHYDVDIKSQQVFLTDLGILVSQKALNLESLYVATDPFIYYLVNALKAKEILVKEKDYIVKDDTVAIVDASTGRVLDGRKYGDGLHQAVEAKEGIPVTSQSKVIASITYQSLFREFAKLSGMTGTAMTEAEEFRNTYDLEVLPVPTAFPLARRDYPDFIYINKRAKIKAVITEIEQVYSGGTANAEGVSKADRERTNDGDGILGTGKRGNGRPVLVGTTSVEASEEIAKTLQARGVPARVLNAKPENVASEAEIVSQAGRLGAVTVATNMAGRGTDILLGGNPAQMAKLYLNQEMNTHVLEKILPKPPVGTTGTTTGGAPGGGDSNEIAAGSTSASGSGSTLYRLPQVTDPDEFFPCTLGAVAKEQILLAVDAVRREFSPETEEEQASLQTEAGATGVVLAVEELLAVGGGRAPVKNPLVLSVRAAMEAIEDDFRSILDGERSEVQRRGGLYVVGTEKHDSRRVDNQLRGRAGRQGDPGTTRFYLSLEDDLVKTFGGNKMEGVMKMFRVGEDLPIESKQASEAIEGVQTKVEKYFQDIRSQVLEFDGVISGQRRQVYKYRQGVLFDQAGGTNLNDLFKQMCLDTIDEIVSNNIKRTLEQVENDDENDEEDSDGSEGRAPPATPGGYPGLLQKLMLFYPTAFEDPATGELATSPTSPAFPLTADEAKQVQEAFDPNSKAKERVKASATTAAGLGSYDNQLPKLRSLLKEKVAMVALERKITELDGKDGKERSLFEPTVRYLTLSHVDDLWSRHMERMGLLKETVLIRRFQGVDPFSEYLNDGIEMFEEVFGGVRKNTVFALFKYRPMQKK